MPELGSPLVLELVLAVLMGVVFFAGVFARGADRRRVGVISAVGLVVLFGLAVADRARRRPLRRQLRAGRAGDLRQAALPPRDA